MSTRPVDPKVAISSAAVEVEGVSVVLGGNRVLSNITMRLARGEIAGLMGPSGAGKSTLLHTIAGLVLPAAGSVSLEGIRLEALSAEDRAAVRLRHCGFVFQFGNLIPELTALDNVALVRRLSGSSRTAARAAASALLSDLGLSRLADRRPGELSGGELQRVSVARALVGDPGVVLADEPTGALDSRNGRIVLDLLLDLVVGRGCALILASHDIGVIGSADYLVQLKDGRIAT